MTERKSKSGTIDVKALLAGDEEFLRALVRTALEEVLEVEMSEALGAEKGERTAGRRGYRSGYYGRTLITRIGKLELRVPQDRGGRFSTELFERYQRSKRALVAALAEMYVQGVSTRKVKAITEELCGHSFSASSISTMNQGLDAALAQFASRPLAEAFPYLILDARYERVREAGVIASQAVLIAIGIDCDGRRQVLAVELANRESRSSWKVDDDCLQELRWLYALRPVLTAAARGALANSRSGRRNGVWIEQRNWRLAMPDLVGRVSISKRDSHDCRRKPEHVQTPHRHPANDRSPASGTTSSSAPSRTPAAAATASAASPVATATLGGSGGDADRPPGPIPGLA